MKIGIIKETFPGERRVALTPNLLPTLTKLGQEILVQTGAGEAAGFPDHLYTEKGAKIGTRSDAFAADLRQIRMPAALI
jgi:NAD(P) transhydrogenase subunit alpha